MGREKKGERQRGGRGMGVPMENNAFLTQGVTKACPVMVAPVEEVDTEVLNGRWTRRPGKFLHITD